MSGVLVLGRRLGQEFVQLLAGAPEDLAGPLQLGGGPEPTDLPELAVDLTAEPPQVATAAGRPALPRQPGVVAVLVEPRPALVRELVTPASAVVDRADEPLVLELGEQRIHRART